MPTNEVRILSAIRTPDDAQVFAIRRDLTGGMNTRQYGSAIGENQACVLYNIDIGVVGETSKRPGSVLIGNDVGDVSPVTLHNFEIQGATDQLLMFENTTLWKWTGSGNWSSLKADFSAATDVGIVSCKESGLSPDDVVIVQTSLEQAFRVDSAGNVQALGTTSGTGNDSPPLSTVMCWYGNRVWVLKNDLLYFSDAYPADYSVAFDTVANSFRIPVGAERVLIPTRDTGIIVMGDEQVWGIAPSVVPAASDKPQPILTNMGVVSKRGAVTYGDNIFFFSQDGLRELKRTEQDKQQVGATYPLSYRLKTEFQAISWADIANLSMVVFDNKIFIAVPTSSTAYDTWVYYPAADAFMVIKGWSPTCWSTYKISGEERLYYGLVNQGKVYRAWYGYTDEGTSTSNGTAINYQEEGRKEDMGQPLVKKNGGEVEVEAASSGNYDLSVYIQFDNAGYNLLGALNLAGNSPIVGVAVVGDYLGSPGKVSSKFHIDQYGDWNEAQLKLQHNATNGTDDITVYERSIITFPETYENE
jgi:hypothetical protein